jgi:hypothetical protein
MRTIECDVIKTQTTDQIIKNEELATIGGNMVSCAKICELQLRSSSFVISLLVPESVFNKIKDDKKIIVKESGWWTTLTDKNVIVKRTNGEVIKPIRMF